MEYRDLPEAWRQVLGAVLGGAVAWQAPEEVAEALNWGVEATTDHLAALDAAGWLEVWERPAGPAVTLSALGAARLGVHLVEVGPDQRPCWSPIGEPEPPAPRARGVCRDARAALLDDVLDPMPPPDVAAELAETAGRAGAAPAVPLRRGRWDMLPYPARLIGQGLTPWPGPVRAGKPPCPACGDAPLRADEYCLCCDRWGLDARLFPAASPRARAPIARPGSDPAAVEAAEAATLRSRRKSKRKNRLYRRMQVQQLPPRPISGLVPLTQPPVGPRPACPV